ncbi:hypothetical protein [Pelagicoccus mobilis]|uniref:Uncharacterized protein n=1 Tax=Pelagicoccus mobilis TaxID=415221 RepID=A0A934VRL3_9BACT|nr:hypothetical protein [Pelagicoccus mobilis]MBK1877733.1 hypothetical protein [Pelagicoccus mobilis]
MRKPLYKALINWYQASDKSLPAWLDRACEKDPELRGEKTFGDELTRALQTPPKGVAPIERDSMAARVLKQITEEDYLAEQAEAEKAPFWGAWVRNAGMAAAAFAIALAGYQFLNTEKTDPSQIEIVSNEQSSEGVLDELRGDWKNPLDQEIEYIVSDAKGALGFLATTFVPSSYLSEEEEV